MVGGLLVSAGVIGLDQLSKCRVQRALALGESIRVLPFDVPGWCTTRGRRFLRARRAGRGIYSRPSALERAC